MPRCCASRSKRVHASSGWTSPSALSRRTPASPVAVRSVARYPASVLKAPADAAGPITRELRALADDLIDTMRAGPATVGLAAPQIGESVRAFALDVTGHPKATTSSGLVVLFDPEIARTEGETTAREGC